MKGSRSRSRKGGNGDDDEEGGGESMKKLQTDMNSWKAITEQKNLNVFK